MRIWILLFGSLLLFSCGPAPAPEPVKNDIPGLEGSWTIKMIHSGGIMGVIRSIEVTADGKFTVQDERSGQTRQGRLSEQELDELNSLVASIQHFQISKSSGCADCFIYDLEISGDSGRISVRLDDISLGESGFEPLITNLRSILDRELIQQNNK